MQVLSLNRVRDGLRESYERVAMLPAPQRDDARLFLLSVRCTLLELPDDRPEAINRVMEDLTHGLEGYEREAQFRPHEVVAHTA